MQLSERVGRRVKLQDLHVLMTVARAGSMRKAAQSLNTVQPAISRAISELEQTLGVRLLDRHRHGVAPTEFGRALIDCGVAVFDELRQGFRNIEHLNDPAAGEVHIGCLPILTGTFVPTLVDRLSRRYPRIVFHLTAAYSETLLRDLHERNVELLIARRLGLLAEDQRLQWEFLFDDFFVVVGSAQSPWARRRRIELAELMNETWVLPPPEGAFGSLAKQAFRAVGLDSPRATVFATSYEARRALLATGRFLSIFPESALRFSAGRPELRVLPVELPLAHEPVGIVTLKNRTLNPVVRLFIEMAREVAKSLTKEKKS
jgi:DNA-binding transcriptional LysR family regulator